MQGADFAGLIQFYLRKVHLPRHLTQIHETSAKRPNLKGRSAQPLPLLTLETLIFVNDNYLWWLLCPFEALPGTAQVFNMRSSTVNSLSKTSAAIFACHSANWSLEIISISVLRLQSTIWVWCGKERRLWWCLSSY